MSDQKSCACGMPAAVMLRRTFNKNANIMHIPIEYWCTECANEVVELVGDKNGVTHAQPYRPGLELQIQYCVQVCYFFVCMTTQSMGAADITLWLPFESASNQSEWKYMLDLILKHLRQQLPNATATIISMHRLPQEDREVITASKEPADNVVGMRSRKQP